MVISRSDTQAVMDTLREAQVAVASRSQWLIPDVLEEQVRLRPSAICLIFGSRRYTWAELDKAAAKYAKLALACGIKPGDCCALMMENRPEFLFAWLGLGKIGAVPGLINTQTKNRALTHAIDTTTASLLMVGQECLQSVSDISFEGDTSPFILVIPDPESTEHIALPGGARNIQDIDVSALPDPDFSALRQGINSTSTCCYIFTSGTTGLPKAALISHGRFLAAGAGFIATLQLSDKDVFYCALPLFHGAALMALYGSALQAGGAMVVRRKFSVSNFWQDVQAHGITVFQYVGEVCRYLVNSPASPDIENHTLRLLVGSGMGIDVWLRFKERFGQTIQIVEGWGATESNGNMTNFNEMPGACGRIPYPEKSHLRLLRYDHAEDALVQDDNGRYALCQAGEVGEMHCQIHRANGDIVAPFEGYTSTEATQHKILRDVIETGDAWFKSGDLFRFDREGYFYFVDRLGDTFRWRGENVSTTEVAQQLSSYSAIENINAYGIEMPGQEGRACMVAIVLRSGCHFEPQAFYRCVVNELPEYARPLFVRILVDADMTANFKHRKTQLREEGFDVTRIKDPLYGLDARAQSYALLDAQLLRVLT